MGNNVIKQGKSTSDNSDLTLNFDKEGVPATGTGWDVVPLDLFPVITRDFCFIDLYNFATACKLFFFVLCKFSHLGKRFGVQHLYNFNMIFYSVLKDISIPIALPHNKMLELLKPEISTTSLRNITTYQAEQSKEIYSLYRKYISVPVLIKDIMKDEISNEALIEGMLILIVLDEAESLKYVIENANINISEKKPLKHELDGDMKDLVSFFRSPFKMRIIPQYLRSNIPEEIPKELQSKFKKLIDFEEYRLKNLLIRIAYKFSSYNCLSLLSSNYAYFFGRELQFMPVKSILALSSIEEFNFENKYKYLTELSIVQSLVFHSPIEELEIISKIISTAKAKPVSLYPLLIKITRENFYKKTYEFFEKQYNLYYKLYFVDHDYYEKRNLKDKKERVDSFFKSCIEIFSWDESNTYFMNKTPSDVEELKMKKSIFFDAYFNFIINHFNTESHHKEFCIQIANELPEEELIKFWHKYLDEMKIEKFDNLTLKNRSYEDTDFFRELQYLDFSEFLIESIKTINLAITPFNNRSPLDRIFNASNRKILRNKMSELLVKFGAEKHKEHFFAIEQSKDEITPLAYQRFLVRRTSKVKQKYNMFQLFNQQVRKNLQLQNKIDNLEAKYEH